MDRGPWFLDPEVLVFGQVAGVTVFVMALIFTMVRRCLVPAAIGRKVAESGAKPATLGEKLHGQRHGFGAGLAPGAGEAGGGSFDL